MRLARNASNPCNAADYSPVYILRLGASGRVPAGRLDRTRVPPGNQGIQERRRLQRGLQQACNLPATSLQPRRHSGVTPVVLRLGPVPCKPPGDAENGQLSWTLLNPFARIPVNSVIFIMMAGACPAPLSAFIASQRFLKQFPISPVYANMRLQGPDPNAFLICSGPRTSLCRAAEGDLPHALGNGGALLWPAGLG